jgi:hypothetical protein
LKLKEIIRPKRFRDEDILRLASHLTERDRQIAKDCFEFRVLTSSQITRLHFTGARTAAVRLDVLYRLRVLDRFRPSIPRGQGTAPYHWILDEAGALIVADHLNLDRTQLGWKHSVAAGIATSEKLAHHVEVNEFFTRLAVEANAVGNELSEWYGERTCHRMFSGRVIPDGWGVLTLPHLPPLHFLVELDRGNETTARLRDKAGAYQEQLPHTAFKDLDPLVLLLVPSAQRARTATAALAGSGAPISVAVWSQHSTDSVLATVLDAEARRQQASSVPAGDGLRSSAGSGLLDQLQEAEREEPVA